MSRLISSLSTAWLGFLFLTFAATSVVGRVNAQSPLLSQGKIPFSMKVQAVNSVAEFDSSEHVTWIRLLAVDSTQITVKERVLVGALLGGGIGAVSGLVLYEIAESALDFGLCDERNPGCESSGVSPTRIESVLIFGAVGAGVGAVIGLAVGGSNRKADSRLRTVVLPAPHGRPTMGLSYRLRLR